MEAVYQGIDVIFHNSLYSILGIIGILVIIAFATIFFKSYKEYKTTMSSSYYYDKKVSNLNIPNIQQNNESKQEPNLKEETILQKNVEERKKEVAQEILKQKEKITEKTQKPVKKVEDILIAKRSQNVQSLNQNAKFSISQSEVKGHNTYIQKMIKEIEKESKKSA